VGGDVFGVVPVEESHESMLFGKSSNLELSLSNKFLQV